MNVILHDYFQWKNSIFSYKSYDKFVLKDMGQADCKTEFWIEKADLPWPADVFQIPTVIKCRQRSICDGLEGFSLPLRQTSYPRWNRHSGPCCSSHTNAKAVSRKGSPLDNWFGFIEWTVWPISKPGTGQRVVYNGHKRVHGLKVLSVTLPIGLIGNIFEPVREYFIWVVLDPLHLSLVHKQIYRLSPTLPKDNQFKGQW